MSFHKDLKDFVTDSIQDVETYCIPKTIKCPVVEPINYGKEFQDYSEELSKKEVPILPTGYPGDNITTDGPFRLYSSILNKHIDSKTGKVIE